MSNWGIRRMALALFAVYVGIGATVLLWPTPVDRGIRGTLNDVLDRLHAMGVPSAVNYSFVEAWANVFMFLPFGILLTLMLGKRVWWITPLVGVTLSVSAELAQHIFLPHRFATVDDVLHNGAGVLLGTLFVVLSRRTFRETRIALPVVRLRTVFEPELAAPLRAAA